MHEQWKPIPGYDGLYEASNAGQIRTANGKTTANRLYSKRVWRSRVLKGRGDNPATGRRVSPWKDGKEKEVLVCRAIAAAWLGLNLEEPYIPGRTPTVNHINGNRFDNRLENLEVVSLGDNIRHAFATGLIGTEKTITLMNQTGDLFEFKSQAEANRFLGRAHSYINKCVKVNAPAIHAMTGSCGRR